MFRNTSLSVNACENQIKCIYLIKLSALCVIVHRNGTSLSGLCNELEHDSQVLSGSRGSATSDLRLSDSSPARPDHDQISTPHSFADIQPNDATVQNDSFQLTFEQALSLLDSSSSSIDTNLTAEMLPH